MLYNLIFMGVSFLICLLGVFIYRYPTKVFEIQKKFYALINWRIEPISLAKEIRNTKLMGLFLIFFVIGCVLYFWLEAYL